MSVRITDLGTDKDLRISVNSVFTDYNKSNLSLKRGRNNIEILYNNTKLHSFTLKDMIYPITNTIIELENILQGYINNTTNFQKEIKEDVNTIEEWQLQMLFLQKEILNQLKINNIHFSLFNNERQREKKLKELDKKQR